MNYKNREELVYLTSFQKDGTELNWNKDLIQQIKYTVLTDIKKEDSDKEGYILRYNSGHRVKVKFLKYLENHKLHSNLSPEKIKKLFITCKDVDEILCNYDEELHQFIQKHYEIIKSKYTNQYNIIMEEYFKVYSEDRILFYKQIAKSPYKTIFSYIYNNKEDNIRKEILSSF